MIDVQRRALLEHDPGTRLGDDPENLHQHRVAARRTRAFLRAARRLRRSRLGALARRPPAGAGPGDRPGPRPGRPHGLRTGRARDARSRRAGGREHAGGPAGLRACLGQTAPARGARRRVLPGPAHPAAATAQARRRRVEPCRSTASPARRSGGSCARSSGLGPDPDDAAVHRLRITLKRARYAAELSGTGGQQTRPVPRAGADVAGAPRRAPGRASSRRGVFASWRSRTRPPQRRSSRDGSPSGSGTGASGWRSTCRRPGSGCARAARTGADSSRRTTPVLGHWTVPASESDSLSRL